MRLACTLWSIADYRGRQDACGTGGAGSRCAAGMGERGVCGGLPMVGCCRIMRRAGAVADGPGFISVRELVQAGAACRWRTDAREKGRERARTSRKLVESYDREDKRPADNVAVGLALMNAPLHNEGVAAKATMISVDSEYGICNGAFLQLFEVRGQRHRDQDLQQERGMIRGCANAGELVTSPTLGSSLAVSSVQIGES